jgi:plasmid stabilization system protein ParE
MNYIITDKAYDDIDKAMAFFESRQSGLSLEFAAQVSNAIEFICRNPDTFYKVRIGLHRYFLDQFPYFMIYTIEDNKVVIMSVIDARSNHKFYRK